MHKDLKLHCTSEDLLEEVIERQVPGPNGVIPHGEDIKEGVPTAVQTGFYLGEGSVVLNLPQLFSRMWREYQTPAQWKAAKGVSA